MFKGKNMKRAIVVEHVCIELVSNFDNFTLHLEKTLGSSDEDNLTLFNVFVQDDVTKKENRRKIKQYQLGNPTTMLRMIENHPGAGLYIPIHLLVYETVNGRAVVEYDLPSSLLAQFYNSKIFSDSITLENMLIKLIRIADEGNEM